MSRVVVLLLGMSLTGAITASEIRLPWIVRIDTVGGAAPSEQGQASNVRPADGPTTGVVWSSDGLIVTSSFNFVREPLVILVTTGAGQQLVAELVARDQVTQLALLRVKASDLPAPQIVTRDGLTLGTPLRAVGFGYATQQAAVNRGVLSAHYRIDGLALQTDANTSPANYGGPLIDGDGRLVGIITPITTRKTTLVTDQGFSGVDFYDSGIGFAIAAEIVADRVALMADGFDLEPGRIGLSLDSRTAVVSNPDFAYPDPPLAGGVQVRAAPGEPASESNICPGDLLVAIDGVRVMTNREVRRMIAPRVSGDRVRFSFLRDETTYDVELELAGPEPAEPEPTDEDLLLEGLKKFQKE